jgi:hypothetical protein
MWIDSFGRASGSCGSFVRAGIWVRWVILFRSARGSHSLGHFMWVRVVRDLFVGSLFGSLGICSLDNFVGCLWASLPFLWVVC